MSHRDEDEKHIEPFPVMNAVDTTMSSGEYLSMLGTDAKLWSEAFVATFNRLKEQGARRMDLLDPSPGEWLFGWFANAIEAGDSAGYKRAMQERNPNWPLSELEEDPPGFDFGWHLKGRWIALWTRRTDALLDMLPHKLPKSIINHITCGNLGRLTVVDDRLHSRNVPTITVEEIMEAMKLDEGVVPPLNAVDNPCRCNQAGIGNNNPPSPHCEWHGGDRS